MENKVIPCEVQDRMKELEKENTALRECVNELKEQIRSHRSMYASEDFDEI